MLDVVEKLGNLLDILEDGRVLFVVSIDEHLRNDNVRRLVGSEVDDESSLRALVVVVGEVNQSLDDLLGVRLVRGTDTTPERTRFESLQVEASDNTEVAQAALEGLPQVLVLVGVGLDNAAISQDDLGVDQAVANETVATSVVGVASTSEETCNTNVTVTTTGDNDTLLLKGLENIAPSAGRAKRGQCGLGVVGGGVQVTEVNNNTVVNVATTSPVAVATRAHGELALAQVLESHDGSGDIVARLGHNNAPWSLARAG